MTEARPGDGPGDRPGAGTDVGTAGGPGDGAPDAQARWAAQLAEAAEAGATACAAQVQAHRAELDQAAGRQRDVERLADRQRRRADALRTRDELAGAAPAMAELRGELGAALRATEVTPALEEAERTARALADALGAEQQARTAVAGLPGAAGPDATAAELRAGAREHVTKSGRLEALRSLSEQAAEEDDTAASFRAAAAALAAQIATTQAGAIARREQRPTLSLQRDQAREAAERLPGVLAEADRYHRAAADMAALVQARADVAQQSEAYLAAKVEQNELLSEAWRLRMARFDGMRAELAAALVDGAPCPVCGSLDHPELCELQGERVTRDQEEAADAEATAASDRAETIGAKLGAADERVAALSARLESDGFTIAVGIPSLEAETRRLHATWQELAAEGSRLAAARLSDAQAALDDLDQSIAEDQTRLAGLTDQHQSELRQATEADQRAARLREALTAQLGGAPDLDTALARERAAAGALTAAADAADATTRAAKDTRRAADLAATAAAEAGFGDPGEARDARRAAGFRQAADRDIREHEARAGAVAELLADPDLDVPLDPPADVTGATASGRRRAPGLRRSRGRP